MKNITFRADDRLLEKAKLKALESNRSLNDLFVEWLKSFSNDNRDTIDYEKYLSKFKHVKIDRKYSREEMNER